MIAWVVITLICVSLGFGKPLTALGRIIVFILWLLVTALFLSTAHANNGGPDDTHLVRQ